MQVLAQAENSGSNWQALGFVAVKQRVRSSPHGVCELPAQVVGILNTRVQALSACRRMHMGRVPCQEHASGAVAIHHANGGLVNRLPRNAPDAMPSRSMHHAFDISSNRLRRRRKLKYRSVRQWTKTYYSTLDEGPKMPVVPIEPIDLDVGNEHPLLVDRFAFQPET